MVFERQSRLKGTGVGALPRNSLPSTAAATTTATSTTAAGSASTTGAAAAAAAGTTGAIHHTSQLPPKQPATSSSSTSTSAMMAGNNTVTNTGLATASLGLRSLLGSARASSIFLDNDSLILPSEHEDNDDDYDDDVSEADSSLNLSLHTMGGCYGTSSAASVGGSSVLTVANTVTEDPTMTFSTSAASAAMVEAELRGYGGGEEYVSHNMTTPQQLQQQPVTTGNTSGGTTTSAPKTSSTGVRSWMTKTATITRSVNSNNNTPMNLNRKVANKMDASQAETPAASGSRPSAQQQQPNNNTPVTAAPTSPPTTPAATGYDNDDHDLKIVATASMVTVDSNSPSANSANSNMKSSTTTPRKNLLPAGPINAAAAMGSLLAPPSPAVEHDDMDDDSVHHLRKMNQDNNSGDGMILPSGSYYNSSKPMRAFCQYGPRWLKFLLIISIVFLLSSIALVAVGVSMQYVELSWANSKSAGATSSAVISTSVDTPTTATGVDPTTASQEDRSSSSGNGADSFEPFTPAGGDESTANDDETFNLTYAIDSMPTQEEEETDNEILDTTTSESINSTQTSPWDGSSSSSSTNTTNTSTTTTTPTLAPSHAPSDTPTHAPSDTPSSPPSPMPSPSPSAAPSDTPTHLPTFPPSTMAPTTMPTTTMQPSSLHPALVAPELLRPTVSVAPSDSPTTTSELLFDMVTFYVLAGQWDANQSEMTLRGEDWLLENLPTQQNNSSAAAFMVHLGDWNGPVGVAADREYEMATATIDDDVEYVLPAALDCSEQAFIQTHIDFSKCSVPVYFTLGSREFGDCPDPEAALTSYRTWLQDYDLRYWDAPQWDVWNDGSSGYQENWIFSFNEVVFAAINLARGEVASSRDAAETFMEDTDWVVRYEATLDWINMNYYDFRRFNRVFCIFVNSGPEDRTNQDFYEELLSRIEFRWIRMHFVIVHRNMPDEEGEGYRRRYEGIRNLDVISVQASVWPPMRVEIDLSNIIRAEVNVDQLTWFDEYVESESI